MCDKRSVVEGLVALTCLVIGFVIYCTSRSHVLFLDWLGIVGSTPVLQNKIGEWLIYCLPDGLWYMSLLLTMSILCRWYKTMSDYSFWPILMMTVAILLPFLLEIAQEIHLIAGTFDWMDIFTYLLTLISFLVCTRNYFLLPLFK